MPKQKKRVVEAVKRYGYTPNLVAKNLVSSRTYTIGIVILEIFYAFFPEVERGIKEVIDEKNYQIFLTNTSDNFDREKANIPALRAKRVHGVLISSSLTTNDVSYYTLLTEAGLPVVFFDRVISNNEISCIVLTIKQRCVN